MPRKALLVIDMLRDFMDPDGALYCGEAAREIIPFVAGKIDEFRRQGELVIFIQDSHEPDDKEFELFPPHSVKGRPGSEIIGELMVKPEDYRVPKARYSAFYKSNLDEILKSESVEEVHVVGVCTSICVMDTVSDLRNRDLPSFVYLKGVADFDQEAHEFALKRMEKILGAKIVS
jgi:nicotinamidase/pyrazinamidase